MGKWMIAGLVLVVCIGLYVIFRPLKRNIECFEDYLMDTQNKSTIPLDIYQTWKTKDLPPKMRECVETLKKQNPEFRHHLYDDKDCYEFIKNHFDPEVAEAYDVLIPGAYKADLWRYCVLYKRGGIYLDIKFQNEGDFKLVELTDREYWTKDIPKSEGGIYNACMICLPGNSILKKCIDRIVENVRTRYYGPSYLHPTGPMLVKSVMSQSELKEVDRSGLKMVVQENPRVIYIHKDNHPILKTYDEYYSKDNPRCQYADLWNQRNIYK